MWNISSCPFFIKDMDGAYINLFSLNRIDTMGFNDIVRIVRFVDRCNGEGCDMYNLAEFPDHDDDGGEKALDAYMKELFRQK